MRVTSLGFAATAAPVSGNVELKPGISGGLAVDAKGVEAIRELRPPMVDRAGNMPSLPGVSPDYVAPSSATRSREANPATGCFTMSASTPPPLGAPPALSWAGFSGAPPEACQALPLEHHPRPGAISKGLRGRCIYQFLGEIFSCSVARKILLVKLLRVGGLPNLIHQKPGPNSNRKNFT